MNDAVLPVRVGHSPDPDDAFMVWAIAEGVVDLRGFAIELVPADIQTLNAWAAEGRLEATAMSVAAYPAPSSSPRSHARRPISRGVSSESPGRRRRRF